MALKKDTSGEGVPLVTAVQRLFDLTVVESVESPDAADDEAPSPARSSARSDATSVVLATDDLIPSQKKAAGQ
jgi:hypothetical protein